jgi:hypothetical protein
LIAVWIEGVEISGRLVTMVLLATLTVAAFSAALGRRLELRRITIERREAFARADRLLARTLERARGEGNLYPEVRIDAELARLRHRDIVRYGSLLGA